MENKFFYFGKILAERLCKENDLSDITYAVLNSSDSFRKFFLSFFFEEDKLSGNGYFVREFNSDIDLASRVDFLYCEEEKKYIIENKINDKDTHDEKYFKAYSDKEGFKRAFIANYRGKVSHYHKVKTWKEFYEYLKRISSDIMPDDEKNIFEIYKGYLSELTAYVEVKKMDLSNFGSIQSFFTMVEEIAQNEGVETYYKNDRLVGEKTYIGKWFKDSFNYYFVCVYLDNEQVKVQTCVKNLRDEKNDDYYLDNFKSLKCADAYPLEGDKNDFGKWAVDMKEGLTQHFLCSSCEVKEQKKIFEEYFKEIMQAVR